MTDMWQTAKSSRRKPKQQHHHQHQQQHQPDQLNSIQHIDVHLQEKLYEIDIETRWYQQLNDEDQIKEINKINRMIDAAKREIDEHNELITYLSDTLLTTIQIIYHDISNHERHVNSRFVIDLICLGVGSVTHSKASRYQLALACLIRDRLMTLIMSKLDMNDQSLCVNMSFYDPLCSAYDRAIIESHNITFDTINQEGRYVICRRDDDICLASIMFAPHCTSRLSMNVLESNWGDALRPLILIANSFAAIMESRIRSSHEIKTSRHNGKQRLRKYRDAHHQASHAKRCSVHSQAPSSYDSSSSCTLRSICCAVTNGIVSESSLDHTLTSCKSELYAAFHSLSMHHFRCTLNSIPSSSLLEGSNDVLKQPEGSSDVWNQWKVYQWIVNDALSRNDSVELIGRDVVP